MREHLIDRRPPQLLALLPAERTARAREEQARDALQALALEALEEGAVLAVHGQDVHAALLRAPHDDLARDDERLLVRERDVLARLDGAQRRREPGKSHHRRHDHVDARMGRRVNERLPPTRKLRADGPPREAVLQAAIRRLIGEHRELRMELLDLRREELIARVRREH